MLRLQGLEHERVPGRELAALERARGEDHIEEVVQVLRREALELKLEVQILERQDLIEERYAGAGELGREPLPGVEGANVREVVLGDQAAPGCRPVEDEVVCTTSRPSLRVDLRPAHGWARSLTTRFDPGGGALRQSDHWSAPHTPPFRSMNITSTAALSTRSG